jgi:hypothetical protein
MYCACQRRLPTCCSVSLVSIFAEAMKPGSFVPVQASRPSGA